MDTWATRDGGHSWSWPHWTTTLATCLVTGGIAFALAYELKSTGWSDVAYSALFLAAIAFAAWRAHRLRMTAVWTIAYAATSVLLGFMLSAPTWLLTWAYACAHNDCPFH
jgi:hypothetical protein